MKASLLKLWVQNPYLIFIGVSAVLVSIWLGSLWYHTGGDPFLLSLFGINDIDDQYYLTHAYNVGGFGTPVRYYAEHQLPMSRSEILLSYPNAIVDCVVGGLARWADLKPPSLGLLMDVITIPLVFFFSCVLWYRLIEKVSTAIFASLIQIFLAGPFNIYQVDLFKISAFNGIISSGAIDLNHCPVLRSVYTQVSLPLFLVSIILMLSATKTRDFIILGIVCGVQIYLYYFAFGASLIICAIYIFLNSFMRGGEVTESLSLRVKQALKQECVFFAALLIVASFGFYILFTGSGPQTVLSDPLLYSYWFISGEAFTLLISAILIFRLVSDSKVRRILSFLVAVTVSYLTIMNLQPILGITLTPFTISKIFIFPLTTAAISVLWIIGVQKVFREHELVVPVLFLILSMVVFERISNPRHSFAPGSLLSQENQLRELMNFVQANTSPEDVFITGGKFVSHYSFRGTVINGEFDFGGIINTLGDRPILINYLTIPPYIPLNESVDRARFQHLLLTGEEGTYFLSEDNLKFPGNLLTGTTTAVKYLIRKILSDYYLGADGHPPSLCELSKIYRADYFVLDLAYLDEREVKFLQNSIKDAPVFTSSRGKLKVWEIENLPRRLGCI